MKNNITLDDINYLSELSAIEFNEEEKKELILQVNNIIAMLNECAEVDVSNISNETFELLSELREDEMKVSLDKDEVLKNAPRKSEGYFVVPKVVDL